MIPVAGRARTRKRTRGRGHGWAPAVFTPLSLSGLQFYLDGDTGSVSSWTDLTANGNSAVQPSAPAQPTIHASDVNGHSDFGFAHAVSVMTIPDAAALKPSTFTAWLVMEQTTRAGFAAACTKTTSGSWNDGWGISNVNGAADGSFAIWVNSYSAHNATFGALALNSWHVLIATYDLAHIVATLDGSTVTSTAYSTAISSSSAAVAVGGDNANGSYLESMTGRIASVGFINRVITSGEMASLQSYLKTRFATP